MQAQNMILIQILSLRSKRWPLTFRLPLPVVSRAYRVQSNRIANTSQHPPHPHHPTHHPGPKPPGPRQINIQSNRVSSCRTSGMAYSSVLPTSRTTRSHTAGAWRVPWPSSSADPRCECDRNGSGPVRCSKACGDCVYALPGL